MKIRGNFKEHLELRTKNIVDAIMAIVKSVQQVKSIIQLKKYNFKEETLVYAMHSKNVR